MRKAIFKTLIPKKIPYKITIIKNKGEFNHLIKTKMQILNLNNNSLKQKDKMKLWKILILTFWKIKNFVKNSKKHLESKMMRNFKTLLSKWKYKEWILKKSKRYLNRKNHLLICRTLIKVKVKNKRKRIKSKRKQRSKSKDSKN